MKAALISVSMRGAALSAKLSDLKICDCTRFAHEAHADAIAVPFTSVRELTERIFSQYDALIFICAAGIAVRAVAPYLRSKQTDPAILVIDENGRFIIPILSGHIGGANVLAEAFAAATGAQAVITTATDAGGRFSPDCFAMANQLRIMDISAAKAVAAAVLHGEPVGLVSEFPYVNCPPELHPGADCRIGICISMDELKNPFPSTLLLIPRDLVLGIGCRKNVTAAQIEAEVEAAGIPLERICCAATIDRKKDEPGLLAFCAKHRLKLVCFTADTLKNAPGTFRSSAFVNRTVGVDNVCERSAVLAAQGALVFPKHTGNGVACAAAKREISLDFAKRRELD